MQPRAHFVRKPGTDRWQINGLLQGFVPSAACMVTCWAFLVAEALLIAEINVHLRRRRRNKDGGGNRRGELELDLEVISVKSMAQETLGEWGGHLATATYLFLSYTSMVAYASKSGEVLSRLVPGVPEPFSGAAFTAALAMLIAGGGTAVTDRVNQLLTFVMIGKVFCTPTILLAAVVCYRYSLVRTDMRGIHELLFKTDHSCVHQSRFLHPH